MHFIRVRVLFALNVVMLILVAYGFHQLNNFNFKIFESDSFDYTGEGLVFIHLARVGLVAVWCGGCFFSVKFLVEMQFTHYMNRLERLIQASEKEGWKPFKTDQSLLFPAPEEMDGMIKTLQMADSVEEDPRRSQILEAIVSRDKDRLKALAEELVPVQSKSQLS